MSEPSDQNHEGQPRRILLVDDEPSILRSLKRTLRRCGYEVLTAEGGAAGIELLKSETVHLIISDQRMPDIAGPEVLAAAYQLQPDAFRITLTGYTDLEAAQKSINDGHVNQFLMKPWDDEHLRRCVADGLRSYELVVENRRLLKLTETQNKQLADWNTKLEEKVEQRTSQVRRQNELLSKVNDVMERSLGDTVNLLASMMDMSNPAFGMHGKRVAEMAKQFGEWLELDTSGLRDLEFAARLHEIGLVGGDFKEDQINQGLSSAKRRKVAESGYRVLCRVAGFARIARVVRDQAERYDAKVSDAQGKEGPVDTLARIIAISDAYDTAVYDRNDPTTIDREAGLRALSSGSGNHLDPDLCELLLKNLSQNPNDGHGSNEIVEVTPRQVRVGMQLVEDLMNAEGLLLARAGTKLGEEMVHRIRQLPTDDLLNKTIRVYAEQEPMAA